MLAFKMIVDWNKICDHQACGSPESDARKV